MKCEKCGTEMRKIQKNGELTDEEICINCDLIPGICPVCKKTLRTKKAEQCPYCFSSWRENETTTQIISLSTNEPNEEDIIRCPKCNSKNIVANKKGFGVGKAIVGGALTGGVGLLGGFVGSNKIKITCLKCGHKWTPGK